MQLTGLLAGAVSTFIILGQLSRLEYRDYYLKAASEQVFIANELRGNRERQLRDRAEANLPGVVMELACSARGNLRDP